MSSTACFSLMVFPPVQYFTKYAQYSALVLDPHERFVKQSYRNRYRILGANNVEDLVIPVSQGKSKLPVKEVKVAYSENWRRHHLQALQSAYGKAPFFQHYYPQIEMLYNKADVWLIDWMLKSIRWAETALSISAATLLGNTDEIVDDFRNAFHPKARYEQPDAHFTPAPYFQCFQHAGFVPNLSIVDLLMNEGPNAMAILHSSVV